MEKMTLLLFIFAFSFITSFAEGGSTTVGDVQGCLHCGSQFRRLDYQANTKRTTIVAVANGVGSLTPTPVAMSTTTSPKADTLVKSNARYTFAPTSLTTRMIDAMLYARNTGTRKKSVMSKKSLKSSKKGELIVQKKAVKRIKVSKKISCSESVASKAASPPTDGPSPSKPRPRRQTLPSNTKIKSQVIPTASTISPTSAVPTLNDKMVMSDSTTVVSSQSAVPAQAERSSKSSFSSVILFIFGVLIGSASTALFMKMQAKRQHEKNNFFEPEGVDHTTSQHLEPPVSEAPPTSDEGAPYDRLP